MLNGWQGYPAMMVSIAPRMGRPSKVVTSSQIGAVAKYPARWAAMILSRAGSFHST